MGVFLFFVWGMPADSGCIVSWHFGRGRALITRSPRCDYLKSKPGRVDRGGAQTGHSVPHAKCVMLAANGT